MVETTFEAIINAPWTKDEDESGLIFATTDDGITGAVGEFMLCWDEYLPLSHLLSAEDTEKMYNLMLHAGAMFRLLRATKTPAAQELVRKITNPGA